MCSAHWTMMSQILPDKWRLRSCYHFLVCQAITSLLVCSFFTFNSNAVAAVTIRVNDFDGAKYTSTSRDSTTNPQLRSPNFISNQIPVNTVPQKGRKEEGSVNKDAGSGYAAEWEYKGKGPGEVDSPSGTQLSPSPSGRRNRSEHEAPNNPSPYPTRRQGPGSWLDSSGYWWLFGGQGPTMNQALGDLWVYGPPLTGNEEPQGKQNSSWRMVYRPENSDETPLSGHPEDSLFPVMCGSETTGRLSLFKGQNWASTKPGESHNSLFNEDEAIWITEIPKIYKAMPGRFDGDCGRDGKKRLSSSSCNNKTEGLTWTSYICCDACLPDGNTTFEFCPQFFQNPILWCNHDSLMAFHPAMDMGSHTIKSLRKREILSPDGKQPTTSNNLISPSKIPKVSQQENISGRDFHLDAKMGKDTTVFHSSSSPANITQVLMKNGSNSQGVGQREKLFAPSNLNGLPSEKGDNITTSSNSGADETRNKILMGPTHEGLVEEEGRNGAEMASTRRTIIPSSGETNRVTLSPSPLPASSTGANKEVKENLVVNWWKFDLISTEWVKMPEVNVRTEEAEQLRDGNCRSVSDQHFLYILCPTKTNLLDRSVLLFDPSTISIHSIGTIHLNNAFYDKKAWHLGRSVLHALRSNKQTVIFLAYHKLLDLWIHDHSSNKLLSVENVWRGSSLDVFQHTSSFYKLSLVLPSLFGPPTTHYFYMENPRVKPYLSFEDPFPDGYFQITIVQDRAVFLPARDAPSLINAIDSPIKSENTTVDVTTEKATSPFMMGRNYSTFPPREISNSQQSPTVIRREDLKHDQSIHSQTSIMDPRPLLAQKRKKSSTSGKDTEKDKRADSGLPKSEGLSASTEATTHSLERRNTTYKATTSSSSSASPVPAGVEEGKSQTSQSKGNFLWKNYNKTNNSKSEVNAQVIPRSKNKRIFGIKGLLPKETTKIDDHSHSQSTPTPTTTTFSKEREDATNEMRFNAGRGSLPVNNESNEKPPTQPAPGESQSHANFYLEPQVLPVLQLNEDARETILMNKELSGGEEEHATTTSGSRRGEPNFGKKDNLSSDVHSLAVAISPGQEGTTTTTPSNSNAKNWSRSLADPPTNIHQPSSRRASEGESANLVASHDDDTHGRVERKEEEEVHNEGHDAPNLENNYVSSQRAKELMRRNEEEAKERRLMSRSGNESFTANIAPRMGPLTSEIVIDSPNDSIQSNDGNYSGNRDEEEEEPHASYYISYSSLGSLLFFALSFGLFVCFGLFVFVRRCVKCPPMEESVLIKEPPPIRYAVIPDELSFHHPHTPIV